MTPEQRKKPMNWVRGYSTKTVHGGRFVKRRGRADGLIVEMPLLTDIII